jgi:hypothetical protein
MRTTTGLLGLLALLAAPGVTTAEAAPKAKYYFKIVEVKSEVPTDEATKDAAREILEKELSGRPEFTSDLGGVSGEAAIVAEMKRRKLQGFDVTVKIESFGREVKPARPGGRLKQLAVNLRLSVFGTTLPGAKLAFSGEGEAGIESEVIERRMEEESAPLVRDVMVQAARQAVDQAVAKLSAPKSQPVRQGKRKRS